MTSPLQPPIIDGRWQSPVHRGYLLQCCDCGLTHRINFRFRRHAVQFQAFRLPKVKK